MKRTCLRGVELTAILMAKIKGKRKKAVKMARLEATAKENTEAIVNIPKAGTTTARRPKGQHSCANAIAYKAPTVKSVVRRVQPTRQSE